MQLKQPIKDYLLAQANADLKKAELTLAGFSNSISFIGDHSTGDLWNDIDKVFELYCDALDRIERLERL